MPTEELDLCPKLPGLSDDLEIALPFGGAMKAIRDISQGVPNDCTMTFNLLIQLQPLLGGVDCLLKILDTLSSLKAFVDNPLNPTNAKEVGEKLLKLSTCFPPLIYTNIFCMIRDILLLIIKLLSCLIEFIDSITSFNATIDFDTAADNPALLEILDCAQSNSALTLEHLLAALKPVEAILGSLLPIADTAGLSIEFPSLTDIAPGADPSEVTDKLKQVVGKLQEVIDVIPC